MSKRTSTAASNGRIFTSSTGAQVRLRPPNKVTFGRIMSQRPEVKPPTYRTPIGPPENGVFEEYPHDETTLKTDEDRAMWQEYQLARRREIAVWLQKVYEFFALEAVEDDLIIPETWIRRRRRYNLEVPEDPDDLKLLYLSEGVMNTDEDVTDFMAECMTLLAGDLEGAERLKDSFRNMLRQDRAQRLSQVARALGIEQGQPQPSAVP